MGERIGKNPEADSVLIFNEVFLMKLTKIAFSVASVLSIVSGVAMAGQIDSSSATLAIEAIKSDAQVVRAPSKTYTFAGDIDARTNEQRLQLQYTLTAGTWAVGAGQAFAATNTLTNFAIDTLMTLIATDGSNANVANMAGVGTAVAVNAFVSTDQKTLVVNLTIPAAPGNVKNYLKAAQFTLNALALGAGNSGISGLAAVAGATACPAPDKNIDISFKHFSNHNGNTDILTTGAADSEHLRVGSTNSARLLNFTQNLVFTFTPATSPSQTDANFVNQRLLGNNFTTIPAEQPGAAAAIVPKTRHLIGSVATTLRSNGLDLDYVKTYGNATASAAPKVWAAGDIDVLDDIGNLAAGQIEVNDAKVVLTLPAAWPTGTVINMTANGAATILATATTIAGQTVITLAPATAANIALMLNGAKIWADFQGGAAIPQTPSIAAVETILKDTVAGAPDLREQDNTCSGTLTGIGGGIKIDVRNYASYAKFGASGPATTVRLINNSEFNTADVYGQMIYADGTYGPYGLLTSLAPREVVNMVNKDIEAKLTTSAAASNPFGSSTVYTSTQGTSVVAGAAAKDGMSDRLRIVSNTGTTLRVQSYMVVGGTVIDTSNAQGVDFENNGSRVPTTAVDAQPVSQDAINGLAK